MKLERAHIDSVSQLLSPAPISKNLLGMEDSLISFESHSDRRRATSSNYQTIFRMDHAFAITIEMCLRSTIARSRRIAAGSAQTRTMSCLQWYDQFMHSLTKSICRTLRAFQADPLRASKTASRSHFTSSSSSRDVFVNPCQRAILRVQSSRLDCLASTTTRGCTMSTR